MTHTQTFIIRLKEPIAKNKCFDVILFAKYAVLIRVDSHLLSSVNRAIRCAFTNFNPGHTVRVLKLEWWPSLLKIARIPTNHIISIPCKNRQQFVLQ